MLTLAANIARSNSMIGVGKLSCSKSAAPSATPETRPGERGEAQRTEKRGRRPAPEGNVEAKPEGEAKPASKGKRPEKTDR